jgi:hypothetical protein
MLPRAARPVGPDRIFMLGEVSVHNEAGGFACCSALCSTYDLAFASRLAGTRLLRAGSSPAPLDL